MAKYSNYSNFLLVKNVAKLSEYFKINDHTIELKEDKQLSFRSIYSLEPVELEILKIYIKTSLANNFMRPSKSLAKALILFDWKPNGSFWLYVDYQELNNLIIKNQYALLLIDKLLNLLSQAKIFT